MAKNNQRKRHHNRPAAAGGKPYNNHFHNKKHKPNPTPLHSDSDNSTPPNPTPNHLHHLLLPYTKDQLIGLISNFSTTDSALYRLVCAVADTEITHKKIFVHGLGWDATRETLVQTFGQYGKIEECSVVLDRNSGKCKGYGFVVFESRNSAIKALEEPGKMIGHRMTHCQLASLGVSGKSDGVDYLERKIYVSNVGGEVDKERLREFFGKFGEIETGPIGFDVNTGKSRGYALFVYKKVEDARKVLEEPHKMFEGRQLHCQKAADGKKNKDGVDAAGGSMLQQQVPLMSPFFPGMPAAPNMMFNPQQYAAALHQLYGGMFLGPNAGIPSPMLAAGMMNMNQNMISPSNSMGATSGPGGFRPSSQSLENLAGSPYGIYGSSMPSFGLPQGYPSTQLHQPASSKPSGSSSAYPLHK